MHPANTTVSGANLFRKLADAAGTPVPVSAGRIATGAAVPLLPLSDRQLLLGLARRSVENYAAGNPAPEVSIDSLSAMLLNNRGCFVTLTCSGSLRGCMGSVLPRQLLYQAVIDNAQSAASRDPRFEPVRASEVRGLRIEVSVLTQPEPLQSKSAEELLSMLHPYEDGVVLQVGMSLATFLPQVWIHIPDKITFLDQLSRKAGCDPLAWRRGEASISIYRSESFHELREVGTALT